jgi:hypothetical protein
MVVKLGDHSRAWEGVGCVPLDEVYDGASVDGPWAFEIKDEGRVVNVVDWEHRRISIFIGEVGCN